MSTFKTRLPRNARRRISYSMKIQIPLFLLEGGAIAVTYYLVEIGKITPHLGQALLWTLCSFTAFNVLSICEMRLKYLSNRMQILYLRAYETTGYGIDHYETNSLSAFLVAAYEISTRNMRQLQNLMKYYLLAHYDLVGFMPPPSSELEKLADKFNFWRPEA
jgi:hypothetical protein